MFTTTASQQSGSTITEMMVALGVGILLSLGLFQIFYQNRANFVEQQATENIQDSIRMAKLLLTRDIRMAGFQGCVNPEKLTANNLVATLDPNISLDSNRMINGYEATDINTWEPALPETLVGRVAAGTDVIVVRKLSSNSAYLASNMNTVNDTMNLMANTLNLQANDIVMITDCELADFVRASPGTTNTRLVHGTPENTTNSLSKLYARDTQVLKYEQLAFYIRDTGRTNNQNQRIIALYEMDHLGNEMELLSGIENMQIDFGIDTNNDGSANQYLASSAVASTNQWDRVVSARVNLLINSVNAIDSLNQTITFDGGTITNNDGLRRETLSIHINLRNRLL